MLWLWLTQERCWRGSYLFCFPAERNSFHLWMQVSTPLCGMEASIWQWCCKNMAVVVRCWKAILKYSWSLSDFESIIVIVRLWEAVISVSFLEMMQSLSDLEALWWSLAETQCDHSDWEMWSLGLLEALWLFWLLETTLLQTTAGGGVYKMNMKMWHSPPIYSVKKNATGRRWIQWQLYISKYMITCAFLSVAGNMRSYF